ncbi:MAG: hypothetical protein HY954_01655 [Deltaproteobacteria bacterium]|nr:hypothetical protein [Deltaproteobacteria bacterium]
MERVKDEFLRHLSAFMDKVLDFMPGLLLMLVILAAGLAIASLVKFLFKRLFDAIKFDNWSDEVGLTSALHNASIRTAPSKFITLSLYWLIIAIFFMAGFASLGLRITDTLASLFFLYLPRFFSAVLVIIFGYFFAGFASRAALLAGVNAGIEYSRLIAGTIRLFILALVFAMALEQLSIAPKIVFAAFTIFFGGISLGLALAFGLGGKEAARRLLEYLVKKKGERDNIDLL